MQYRDGILSRRSCVEIITHAIDGNSYGIGIRHHFDGYRIYTIPAYGTKNKRFLYQIDLDWDFSDIKGLSAGLTSKEYGGIRSEGIRFSFSSPERYNQASVGFSAHRLRAARDAPKLP